MASKAITGLWGERAEPKGPVGNVTIDSIAAWRRQADPSSSTAASAQRAYLKASELPPSLVQHHHLHLPLLDQRHHLGRICLQIKKQRKHPIQQTPNFRGKKPRNLRGSEQFVRKNVGNRE